MVQQATFAVAYVIAAAVDGIFAVFVNVVDREVGFLVPAVIFRSRADGVLPNVERSENLVCRLDAYLEAIAGAARKAEHFAAADNGVSRGAFLERVHCRIEGDGAFYDLGRCLACGLAFFLFLAFLFGLPCFGGLLRCFKGFLRSRRVERRGHAVVCDCDVFCAVEDVYLAGELLAVVVDCDSLCSALDDGNGHHRIVTAGEAVVVLLSDLELDDVVVLCVFHF